MQGLLGKSYEIPAYAEGRTRVSQELHLKHRAQCPFQVQTCLLVDGHCPLIIIPECKHHVPAWETSKLINHRQIVIWDNRITFKLNLLLHFRKNKCLWSKWRMWPLLLVSCVFICRKMQAFPKGLDTFHKGFLFLWTYTEPKYFYRDVRTNVFLSPWFNMSHELPGIVRMSQILLSAEFAEEWCFAYKHIDSSRDSLCRKQFYLGNFTWPVCIYFNK